MFDRTYDRCTRKLVGHACLRIPIYFGATRLEIENIRFLFELCTQHRLHNIHIERLYISEGPNALKVIYISTHSRSNCSCLFDRGVMLHSNGSGWLYQECYVRRLELTGVYLNVRDN
jgi:hypothetical protein